MKIVDYAGLMKEPEGTIYQDIYDGRLGHLQIFGGGSSYENKDYNNAQFTPTLNYTYVFGWTIEETRKAYPFLLADRDVEVIWYPSGFGRDGMFDYDRKYLVWELKDREKFAAWLLDPELAVSQVNDDVPHDLVMLDDV